MQLNADVPRLHQRAMRGMHRRGVDCRLEKTSVSSLSGCACW